VSGKKSLQFLLNNFSKLKLINKYMFLLLGVNTWRVEVQIFVGDSKVAVYQHTDIYYYDYV